MSDPTNLDDLQFSWDALSHRDDCNVPCVYPAQFRRLLAEEYERSADNNATVEDLRARAQALRDTPDHWGYRTRDY